MAKRTIHNQTPDKYVGQAAGQPRQLPTGYVGTNIPHDFNIPSCGVEDVDKALFTLFEKHIGFNVVNANEMVNVPVIFATGERFAMVQRKKALRDNNGTLILPLISIRRTGIEQKKWSLPNDIGDMIIKKRLSPRDAAYQAVLNKQGLKNQSTFLDTTRTSMTDAHIYEFITIPFPNFFIANYEIVFWTQYTQHMNQMLEKLMSSYHAQGNQYKISSDNGYWFVAYMDEQLTPADNFEEFADQERIIKYTFNVNVPGYIVAPRNPGDMSPLRSYISAPNISFEYHDTNAQVFLKNEIETARDKFMLDDVNVDTLDGESATPQRENIPYQLSTVRDPFTGKQLKAFVKLNKAGESTGRLDMGTSFEDL